VELFLKTLVGKAEGVAKKRKAKLLTASHLCVPPSGRPTVAATALLTSCSRYSKAGLAGEETFDFLKGIVGKAPDLPAEGEAAASDDDKPAAKSKPRAPAKKKAAEDGEAPKPKRARAPPKPKAAGEAGAARKGGKETKYMDTSDDEEELPAAAAPAAPPPQPAAAAAAAPEEAFVPAVLAPAAPVAEEEDYDA
jgi:flagellum-specific peptidoglycan hydrolase FlgJ